MKTHFIFSNFISKIVTFMRKCGKYEGWNFNSGNYLFTTDTK